MWALSGESKTCALNISNDNIIDYQLLSVFVSKVENNGRVQERIHHRIYNIIVFVLVLYFIHTEVGHY